MQIVRDPQSLRTALAALGEGTIALVPTMGALHAGHMALIAEATRRADHVIASIFVNPAQFGAGEDLDAYPRREQTDAAMLEAAGCALLWLPPVAAMYPTGFATTISVAGVTRDLEGAVRPSHFDGVATVVAKLFNQVRPDVALFGEKDWQQLAVIRRLTLDLDLGVDIIAVSTEREEDGLALSSRNAYLSDDERAAARALPRALGEAARAIEAGNDVTQSLAQAVAALEKSGFECIDYFDLRDAETLDRPSPGRPARLLVAARLGRTRLLDNLAVNIPNSR